MGNLVQHKLGKVYIEYRCANCRETSNYAYPASRDIDYFLAEHSERCCGQEMRPRVIRRWWVEDEESEEIHVR